MFRLFKSLVEIVEDVADITLAPVEIVVEVIKKPLDVVAETANELVKDVKDTMK